MFLGTFNYLEVFDKISAGQMSGGLLTAMAIFIFLRRGGQVGAGAAARLVA